MSIENGGINGVTKNVKQTDKEKLVALLTEFDIGFKEIEDNVIKIRSDYKNANGYLDFYAAFHFTPDDTFDEVGIWE